jgi:hypothetical protein
MSRFCYGSCPLCAQEIVHGSTLDVNHSAEVPLIIQRHFVIMQVRGIVQPRQRLVGCCRDFTVLFVAIARHKGIPSRAGVGFARYFFDGWLRWRLVGPEIGDDHTDPAGGASFDALDVPLTAS